MIDYQTQPHFKFCKLTFFFVFLTCTGMKDSLEGGKIKKKKGKCAVKLKWNVVSLQFGGIFTHYQGLLHDHSLA